jgi:hypothetical protein
MSEQQEGETWEVLRSATWSHRARKLQKEVREGQTELVGERDSSTGSVSAAGGNGAGSGTNWGQELTREETEEELMGRSAAVVTFLASK